MLVKFTVKFLILIGQKKKIHIARHFRLLGCFCYCNYNNDVLLSYIVTDILKSYTILMFIFSLSLSHKPQSEVICCYANLEKKNNNKTKLKGQELKRTDKYHDKLLLRA